MKRIHAVRSRTLVWHALALGCLSAAGCSSIASRTSTLSDERILSETGGVPGMSRRNSPSRNAAPKAPAPIVTLKARNGRTYACTVNGRNLLSFGMTNPPVCQPR